jgi:hypothetical protein
MVFIIDEGSRFKAPLPRLWQYVQSQEEHNHPSQLNPKFSMDGERAVVEFDSKMPDGSLVHHKARSTMLPPLGFFLEYLDGPFAGSRMLNYYTPKGNETGVTVVGEYVSPVIKEEHKVKEMALKSLEIAFGEDSENIRKMK